MATSTMDLDIPDRMDIRSGTIDVGSVLITSGAIRILSGLIGVTSAETHITSGIVTIGSGGQSIGRVNITSGRINISSGLIGVTSGRVGILSGEVHIMSGEITAASGTNVTTRLGGESCTPFSGYACTNTYVYSGVGFLKYSKATILLECISEGSGVSWTVRGHPVSGLLTYSLGSGQLTSGEQTLETLTDAYEYIEVGVENTVDNRTGIVTVTMARK